MAGQLPGIPDTRSEQPDDRYQEEYTEDDPLGKWYSEPEESPKAASSKEGTSKSGRSNELGSSPFSVVHEGEVLPKSRLKDDESLSTRELLKMMMMEQHEKTLEKVLSATASTKGNETSKEDKEVLVDKMEDQKIKALELEALGEVSEGNS